MTQLPIPSTEAIPTQPLQALLDPTIAKGRFSNLVGVRSTAHEFILDFMVQFGPEAHIVSRIVMTPDHTRRLVEMLAQNYMAWTQSNQPQLSSSSSEPAKPRRRSKATEKSKPATKTGTRRRK